jgi:hypothetical protein
MVIISHTGNRVLPLLARSPGIPERSDCMKKIFSLFLAVMILAVFTVSGLAAEKKAAKKPAEKPNAVMVDVITVKASIEAVDAASRTITLKMPDGMQRTVKLGPEVKNFDQIKAGDTVTARFVESLAVVVAKTGEAPAATEKQVVEVAPKGEKPGIIVVDTIEMNAVVKKIDYKKREITLKGPEGNERTFKVDKAAKKFKNIKKGDDVYVRFTEALAINVEKPAQ